MQVLLSSIGSRGDVQPIVALGRELREAVQRAKDYVVEAIRRAPQIGSGHGPLAHFR